MNWSTLLLGRGVAGDVITKVDGVRVRQKGDLFEVLGPVHQANKRITVEYYRNGKTCSTSLQPRGVEVPSGSIIERISR